MTAYNPLPYEIKRPIVSFLRTTGQTIAYADFPHLVEGRLKIDDVDRAWYSGAISIDDVGHIAICGISVRAKIDATKLRNNIVEYLRSSAPPKDIVDVATLLGIGL